MTKLAPTLNSRERRVTEDAPTLNSHEKTLASDQRCSHPKLLREETG